MASSIYKVTKISAASAWANRHGGIGIHLLTPRGETIAELSLDTDQVRAIAVQVLQVVANELTGHLGFEGADLKMEKEQDEEAVAF